MTDVAWVLLAALIVALVLLAIAVLGNSHLAAELRALRTDYARSCDNRRALVADLLTEDEMSIRQARRANQLRYERDEALARVAEVEARELPQLAEMRAENADLRSRLAWRGGVR